MSGARSRESDVTAADSPTGGTGSSGALSDRGGSIVITASDWIQSSETCHRWSASSCSPTPSRCRNDTVSRRDSHTATYAIHATNQEDQHDGVDRRDLCSPASAGSLEPGRAGSS